MKILAIQNRMGIGDMVIFLPYIEAVAKKFNSQITLLVKENSKVDQLIKNNEFIKEIILLKRSNIKKDYHDGAIGFFRLVKEIKEYNFDKVIIFNSSLRFNLICKLAGIKKVYQYPLLQKKNQNINTCETAYLSQKFTRQRHIFFFRKCLIEYSRYSPHQRHILQLHPLVEKLLIDH